MSNARPARRDGTPSTEGPGSLRAPAIAIALFALALVPRLLGIGSFLPHAVEPDSYVVRQMDTLDREGISDRTVAGWKYPHLIATVGALAPGAPALRAPAPDADVNAHLRAASASHVRARTVVATFAALAAPAAFLIALRGLALRWAALAGVLAALSLLNLTLSTQARPHAAVAGTLAVSMLASVRYAERATLGRAVAAALAAGAAASTLHFGASAFASLGAAWFIARRRVGRGDPRPALHALCAVLICTSIVAWFYVRSESGYGYEIQRKDAGSGRLWMSGHGLVSSRFDGAGWSSAARAFFGADPVTSALAVVGLAAGGIAAVRGRIPAAGVVVTASALPTLLVLGSFSVSYPRFYACLTAPLALLAAVGASRIARKAAWGPVAVGAAVLGACIPSLEWTRLRARPDTYEVAARHLRTFEGRDAELVVVNARGIPVASDVVDAEREWTGGPWDRYQQEHGPLHAEAFSLGYASYASLAAVLTAADVKDAARAFVSALTADAVLLAPN
ncbi:MAG: hypothetical protein AAFP22_01895, partial [Planctomycetota bacterium]